MKLNCKSPFGLVAGARPSRAQPRSLQLDAGMNRDSFLRATAAAPEDGRAPRAGVAQICNLPDRGFSIRWPSANRALSFFAIQQIANLRYDF